MASNKHEYKIDLNLSQQSKAVLEDLKSVGGDVEEMNKKLSEYAKYGIDAGNEYRKTLHQQTDELEKQIQIKERLKAETVANNKLSENEKKLALKQADIEIKKLKAKQKELQVRAKIQKTLGITFKEESTALKITTNLVKAQEKLNSLLGKEGSIRKGLNKIAQSKVAKVAKGSAIGVAAAGAALVGSALSDVDNVVAREKALRGLKVDPELATEVFYATRAGYDQIVDSLNKLSGKFSDKGDLVAAAIADIRFPGVADMYLANTSMGKVNAQNMQSVLEQIQKSSGAQDLSSAIQASLKASSVTYGKLTRDNYIQAYAALQGIGVDEEHINRIIRHVSNQGGDFIENFNKYMQKGAGLRGQTSISAQTVALDKLDYSIKDREKTDAEKLQEDLAKMQMAREKISIKLVPVLTKLFNELEKSGVIEKLGDLVDGLIAFLKDVEKEGFWKAIAKALKAAIDYLKDSGVLESVSDASGLPKVFDTINKLNPFRSTGNAQGGLVTSPSLVGEMGPELVLPLNNPGRCQNIVNNYTNTNNFALQGPQTALSLSQSISNNRFIKTASTF